jgi:hypothetical protein
MNHLSAFCCSPRFGLEFHPFSNSSWLKMFEIGAFDVAEPLRLILVICRVKLIVCTIARQEGEFVTTASSEYVVHALFG